MLIESIADFCLQYDEPLGLLRLEWVSGPVTQTMQASAAQLLQLARQLQVRHLLIDMNTVPDIPAEEESWLGTHWMPGIVQLPLERLVLVIDSLRVHNQLAIDALHDLVQPAIRFDPQYFTSPRQQCTGSPTTRRACPPCWPSGTPGSGVPARTPRTRRPPHGHRGIRCWPGRILAAWPLPSPAPTRPNRRGSQRSGFMAPRLKIVNRK